jgi:hypothetical protein
MEPRHCLLLKAVVDDSDDASVLASLTELRQILTVPFAEFAVYRGLQAPDLYAYGALEGAAYRADRDLQRFDAMARQLPVFATSAPAIDRLENVFTATGASAGASAGFRYIVETDVSRRLGRGYLPLVRR